MRLLAALLFCSASLHGQMFGGFQNTGNNIATYRARNLFAGFAGDQFGNIGMKGSIPTTGMVAWFDPATNITLNGSTVSAWSDISGTYTLSQATASNQPTYTQTSTAGKPQSFLRFDGSNDQLVNNVINLGEGSNSVWTVVAIGRVNVFSSFTNLLNYNGAAATTGFYDCGRASAGGTQSLYNDGSLKQTGGISITANVIYVFGTEINHTNTRLYQLLNGTYRAAQVAISATPTGTNGLDLRFGNAGFAGGSFCNCDLYDVIFYNRALTEAEWSNINNYVRSKYGQ